MKYPLALLVLVVLGDRPSPAFPSAPATTLLGHWQSERASSVQLTRAGRPIGAEKSMVTPSVHLTITPTRLSMVQTSLPADTTEWAYTRRQDALVVRYTRFQNRPYHPAYTERWRIPSLTPTTLVVEHTIKEGMTHPLRLRWYYHC